MSDIEKRLEHVEAQLSINQTITRYCRSLDWLDEELLRTCYTAVSYTHLRAHETGRNLVCRLLLEKKKKTKRKHIHTMNTLAPM